MSPSSADKDEQAHPGPGINARVAAAAQALAAPARIRTLNLLAQHPRSVDELAGLLGQSVATTSAQLKVLRQAGFVRRRAQGRRAIHELAGLEAARVWTVLRDFVLATDGESRALMHEVDEDTPPWQGSLESLAAELRAGSLRALDLRSPEEWQRGHLPAARNLPFEELREETPTLARRPRYVVYCRGPYCAKAIEGTRTLAREGWKVERLPFGVVEWELASLALEAEAEVDEVEGER